MRDGKKLTYEKLFYHVPKRKNAGGGSLASSKEQSSDSRRFGGRGASQTSRDAQQRIQGFPAQVGSWCKKLKIDYIRIPNLHQPERGMVCKTQDEIFGRPHREGR